MSEFEYAHLIAALPDYPQPGVTFRDITPLLADADGFPAAVEAMAEPFRDKGITKIVGTEARGFMFGAPLASILDAGFVPARKPGKLPREVISQSYDLEYGKDSLEMHVDALGPDDVVLIADDLIATGGTAIAAARMITQLGAKLVGMSFLIELTDLPGRAKIEAEFPEIEVTSLVKF